VIQWPLPGGGDAIGSGFLYQGKLIPLRGEASYRHLHWPHLVRLQGDARGRRQGSKTLAPMPVVSFGGKVYDTMPGRRADTARGGKDRICRARLRHGRAARARRGTASGSTSSRRPTA
jgi:hypothetical protein